MFLLGHTLHHTIKTYRLYMADTEEFITHYPDDHIQDWPCVCLVTEDDRHYNVAVGEPAHPQEDLSGGLQWLATQLFYCSLIVDPRHQGQIMANSGYYFTQF